ncbi:dCTP deaminase [Micromonospora echinospora]|uniref:dCTP deaminase n=1 Tax=Micromonospora echinospora TaxID=1877 RepID=UPI003CF9673B
MILSGPEIRRQVERDGITVTPFDPEHLNPNSIDLTLGDTILRYRDEIIDPRQEQDVEEITIPRTGLLLEPLGFCLGSSREIVGSTQFVPVVHAKSSTARAGLFVHVTADLIDIGSIGNVTFQLFSTLPLRIFPGMRLAQMTFWKPQGDIVLYRGKYQGSKGPRKSMISQDPFWQSLFPVG